MGVSALSLGVSVLCCVFEYCVRCFRIVWDENGVVFRWCGLGERVMSHTVTVILFVGSVLIALYMPSLASVVEISGLMALFFGFFFPGN